MAARRDQFVLVAAPRRAAESEAFLRGWLRELDGHPGYLGGAVLRESAGEVFPDTARPHPRVRVAGHSWPEGVPRRADVERR